MCLGKHGMGSLQPQHLSNTSRPAPKPLPHFICHPWSQGTLFCTHSPWKNFFSTLFSGRISAAPAEEKGHSPPALSDKIHTW